MHVSDDCQPSHIYELICAHGAAKPLQHGIETARNSAPNCPKWWSEDHFLTFFKKDHDKPLENSQNKIKLEQTKGNCCFNQRLRWLDLYRDVWVIGFARQLALDR